jgi:GT2 family glycosyltransferase
LLRRCLTALQASTIADELEIVVVDNASTDFDADALEQEFQGVVFRPQARNTTWTGGNNLAFDGSSGDFVLLLNPDTLVEEEAIERAIDHLDADTGLVGLGAYLIGPDGELQRYYRRLPGAADLPIILFERIFRGTRQGRRYLMVDEPFSGRTRVPQPPGAFLLIRRKALGGWLLDSRYLNFVSDVDLCRRVGGNIAVYPDVRCQHIRAGAGVGTRNPRERMRLYHDLAWGFSIYFESASTIARVYVRAWLTVYLLSRLTVVAARAPKLAGEALRMLSRWLSSQPPTY